LGLLHTLAFNLSTNAACKKVTVVETPAVATLASSDVDANKENGEFNPPFVSFLTVHVF